MPHLQRGADQGLYLSWLEDLEGPQARLAFSKLTPAGWSPARPIASGEDWFNNWADRPSIAALADGTLVAHWLQRLGVATYAYGVRFSLSRDAGASWDEPRWLHTDRQPVEHGFASFAVLDADTLAAVWLDGRATNQAAKPGSGFVKGPQRLYFRTLASDGSLGPELCLDDSVCDCCPTSLVSLGSGKLLVSYRDRMPDERRDVNLASFAEGRWSEPRCVDEESWTIAGCPVNGPSLDAKGERFGLVWYSAAGDQSRVLAAIGEDSDDTPLGLPVDLGAPEGRAAVVQWDAETLYVAWLEHDSKRPSWMLRSLDSAGQLGEPQALVQVPDTRASGYARLARDGRDLIFVWTDPQRKSLRSLRLTPRP